MIVIDPRRTEVADVADLHLQLRPGTDAFLLAAMLAIILRRGGEAADVPRRSAPPASRRSAPCSRAVPIDAWVAHAGVPLADVERAVDMILAARVDGRPGRARHPAEPPLDAELVPREAALPAHRQLRPAAARNAHPHAGCSRSSATREGERSTRDRPGDHRRAAADQPLRRRGADRRPAPRARAVWVESNNPANTAADTARFEAALPRARAARSWSTSPTPRPRALADYVLPAAAQYEKWEATLFNLRVAAELLPPARAAVRAARRARCPSPRSTRACSRAMGELPSDDELAELRDARRRAPRQDDEARLPDVRREPEARADRAGAAVRDPRPDAARRRRRRGAALCRLPPDGDGAPDRGAARARDRGRRRRCSARSSSRSCSRAARGSSSPRTSTTRSSSS